MVDEQILSLKNLGSLLECEAVTDGLKARIEAKCLENKHFTVDRLHSILLNYVWKSAVLK